METIFFYYFLRKQEIKSILYATQVKMVMGYNKKTIATECFNDYFEIVFITLMFFDR